MLFNSLSFVIFLPAVLLVYHHLPHRAQNRFLLLASCYFYASWDWRFLFPLLFSASIDYYCALKLEDLVRRGEPVERRRKYLVLSVVTNLGLLGFFKYFNFFSSSLQDLLHGIGWSGQLYLLEIILPVGISFYTFQALSYTIDVYRGKLHATRSFPDFLLCVLYFPHLVAGPIQRAENLLRQVITPRSVTRQQVVDGLHLIAWGFFKKIVIADNLAPIVNQIFSQPSATGFETMIGAYAFAFQIYCDFSGYTDIARGVAKLMGFEFVLNFNLPYLSTNPQEFWSRWHISLSTWLRDYLYISLGGNRHGPAKTYRNLMVTMVLGGLWHGAAWNFILWGFYQGLLLVVHRMLKPFLDSLPWPRGALWSSISFGLRVACFFQLVCYGWLLFRAESFGQIVQMTRSLVHPLDGYDPQLALRVFLIASPLIIVQVIQHLTRRLEFLDFAWIRAEARVVVYAVFAYLVLFRGGEPQSFIYFQF